HQRQRDRPRLHRHRPHPPAAGRHDPQPGHPCPHPGRAVGAAGRPRRSGRVSGLGRIRLHPRPPPGRRRRMAGPLDPSTRWAGARALPSPLLWGFAAATAICLGSLATTTDLYSTRDEIFFRLSIMALVLAAVVTLTDRAKIRVALGGLALIGAIEAVIGLAQH